MQTDYIAQKDINKLLADIAHNYRTYALEEKDGRLTLLPYAGKEDETVVFDCVRSQEPIKSFFFKAHEKVAGAGEKENLPKSEKPVAIIGAKSCDIQSLKTQDAVFLDEDLKDAFYAVNRENNLIITADCSYFAQSCFCLLLDLKPYVESGFDLNITKIRDGFLVDVGSKNGEEIIANKRYIKKPTENQLNERVKARQKLVESFKDSACAQFSLKGKFYSLIKDNHDSQVWKDHVKTCVECGGCNLVCPTCHCFLLYDTKKENNYERFKVWDACQYAGFARVAGGANPRKKLYERLRNRYLHKFVFFNDNHGFFACTGCGRCIDVCMGKIDMRKVISALEKK